MNPPVDGLALPRRDAICRSPARQHCHHSTDAQCQHVQHLRANLVARSDRQHEPQGRREHHQPHRCRRSQLVPRERRLQIAQRLIAKAGPPPLVALAERLRQHHLSGLAPLSLGCVSEGLQPRFPATLEPALDGLGLKRERTQHSPQPQQRRYDGEDRRGEDEERGCAQNGSA